MQYLHPATGGEEPACKHSDLAAAVNSPEGETHIRRALEEDMPGDRNGNTNLSEEEEEEMRKEGKKASGLSTLAAKYTNL